MSKRRFLSTCLAACMLAGSLGVMSTLSASAAPARNLFTNGNFDHGLNGWSTWTNSPSDCTFEHVSDGGPDGSGALRITNTAGVAASVYQFFSVRKGGTYKITADVKYENVSTDGNGLILGTSMYDSASNNIGEPASSPRYGTSDGWTTMTAIIKLDHDKMTSANAGPRLWFSTGTVMIDNVSITLVTETEAESATYDLTVSETPNRYTVDALGVEWDPKLLLPCNREMGVTEEDLAFMKSRLEILGIQAVRMMIMPEWFEPVNDNEDPAVAAPDGFNFDSDEIKNTLAYLKVCHELGIKVNLTWWGAAVSESGWLCYPDAGDWISAPNDLDEMAENIAYFVKYVHDELKYDCIDGIILHNEPSYAFHVAGGAVDFDYYVEYYRTVHQRLIDDGLREDIKLIGADDSQHFGWYCRAYDALKDICDAFDSHNYAWEYNTPNLDSLFGEFVSARTQYGQEKPFFMGEFGDGTTVGAYYAESVETYGRGLYLASAAVTAFKSGAAGLSYWGLHDVYYYLNTDGGDNGGLMETGLIGFKTDGEWIYRPTYYAWGMMCNYIPYGSEIYHITGESGGIIDAVAVKTPEGKWSVIAVNRSGAEQTVNISSSLFDMSMNVYLYADGQLPTDGSMIAASDVVSSEDGVYSIGLPAYSFKVLSNMEPLIELPETTIVPETTLIPETTYVSENSSISETTIAFETTVFPNAASTTLEPATEAVSVEAETSTEGSPVASVTNVADVTTTVDTEGGCGSSVVAQTAAVITSVLGGVALIARKKKNC